MQIFMVISIVAGVALVAIAANMGPTATLREKRALKWLAALGPFVSLAAVAVALQQLAVTRESGERQDRAYFLLLSAHMTEIKPGIVTISVKYSNTGKTPAFDTRTRLDAFIREYPTNRPFDAIPMVFASAAPIAPGGAIETSLPINLSNEQFELLVSKKAAIYAFGIATYVDVFNKPHVTKTSLFKVFDENQRSGIDTALDGNSAD